MKWNTSTEHLKQRIHDLAQQLTPGSDIVFMNQLETTDADGEDGTPDVVSFSDHMKTCGFERNAPQISNDLTMESWLLGDRFPDIKILHSCGDAANYSHMAPLIANRAFDTVVVLGTAA